jgi:hypothetical protein
MRLSNSGKEISEQIKIDESRLNMTEAFYLIISKPEIQFTFIVRYCLFNSKNGLKAYLNAWLLDRKNNIDCIFSLDEMKGNIVISEDKLNLNIGNCSIDPGQLTGTIQNETQKLKWLLNRDKEHALGVDRFGAFVKKIKKNAFQSPDCKGSLTGTIEVGSQIYSFDNDPYSTGHYFGVKKKISWMWANCVNFKEDKEALFEGISANDLSLSIPFFSMYWRGKFYNCSGFFAAFFKYCQMEKNMCHWHFKFKSDGYLFDVAIHAKPEDMIVHTHELNEQDCLYTAITYCAHMEVLIIKNNKLIQKLSSEGASFEFTRPEPFPEVKRSYQHYKES